MILPVPPEGQFMSLAYLVPADLSLAQVVDATHSVRVVRGWIDWLETQLASRSNELNLPAADLFARTEKVSAAEARTKDRRSKALEDAPSFSDALATGSVSAAHDDALANTTARLGDQIKDEFLGHEASLLDEARHSTPEHFARHCRSLADRISKDQGVERSEHQKRQTTLRRSINPLTGMGRISGELDPELTERIFGALDAEVAALITKPGNTAADRNHLAAIALGNLVSGGHQAIRPTITEAVVIIDLETLRDGLHEDSVCELGHGMEIPVEMARRLACNANIIPVVLNGDGVPLDLGRAQRFANHNQRLALRAIYRTCAFDGCDVPFERCQIHHLVPWDDDGNTDLKDLLPTCEHHHHQVHEGGWTIHLSPDRTLNTRQPDGTVWAETPIEIRTGTRAKRDRQRQRERTSNQTMQPLQV
jgi:hypothetical protein